MGFQPTRQSLILGDLTVIFKYTLDAVGSIILLKKTNLQMKKENISDSTMNQKENIKK